MKQDLKETWCLIAYIVLFIPWLILTILVNWVYKPLDKLMMYSAQFMDDRCRTAVQNFDSNKNS